MTRVVTLLAASLVVAALAGCATGQTEAPSALTVMPAAAQTAQTILEVGGLERAVTIRDIDAAATALVPAMILLHGATGDSARAENGTGMTELARANGFVVAYPDGTTTGRPIGGNAWNAGRCCAQPVVDDIDDVAFIEALIDELVSHHGVDPTRIYMGGFSNGGMMSYRAACEIGDRLAGIFVVGGAFNVEECAAPRALPVLIIHGDADATVPYEGGEPNPVTAERLGTWVNAPVSDAVSFWFDRDSCTGSSRTRNGTASLRLFNGCAEGSGLELVTVSGGRHQWPTELTEGFDASGFIVGYFGLAA